jgi:AcrR family transcriptional regulator
MSDSAPAKRAGAAAPIPRRTAGRASSGRRQVEEIQRARVLGALCEVVAEHGLPTTTVAQVVARAGVSRRTFYELFADRDECVLAAFDGGVALAAQRVVPAYRREQRWRDGIRAGLLALLAFLRDEPEIGALCVVHVLGAGEDALRRRAEVLQALAAAVDEGRREARRGHEPAPLTAEGAVGAVLAVVHARLLQRRRESMTPLAGALTSMILLPYLGSAAATRELARPAPPEALPHIRRSREDPLHGLDMRLTYRTVRVLMAIAETPRASNREIALAAEIADQGQASKLLRRLEHLGLTENVGHRNGTRGEPNAWTLTARGERLRQTTAQAPQPLPR